MMSIFDPWDTAMIQGWGSCEMIDGRSAHCVDRLLWFCVFGRLMMVSCVGFFSDVRGEVRMGRDGLFVWLDSSWRQSDDLLTGFFVVPPQNDIPLSNTIFIHSHCVLERMSKRMGNCCEKCSTCSHHREIKHSQVIQSYRASCADRVFHSLSVVRR